jgi:hypothetical protein
MSRYFAVILVAIVAAGGSTRLLRGAEKKPSAEPTSEDLRQMVRDLPKGSVETFTKSIQPMLLHHCGAAGCHASDANNDLKLSHISVGQTTGRRITQRNLHTVLSYVNREDPTHSQLLTVPLGPHGNAKSAIFDPHEAAQFKRLYDWTVKLAQSGAPAAYQEFDDPFSANTAVPSQESSTPRTLPKDVKKAQPLTAKGRKPAEPRSDAADPFDPAAFNRRFAPKPPSADKKDQAKTND